MWQKVNQKNLKTRTCPQCYNPALRGWDGRRTLPCVKGPERTTQTKTRKPVTQPSEQTTTDGSRVHGDWLHSAPILAAGHDGVANGGCVKKIVRHLQGARPSPSILRIHMPADSTAATAFLSHFAALCQLVTKGSPWNPLPTAGIC